MAATGFYYQAPSGAEIVNWTGLNAFIEDSTAAVFLAWLEALTPDAEGEVALIVGEDAFDGDGWTQRQAGLLRRAVAYLIGGAALTSPEVQKVTGSHSPLRMEDAREIADASERLRNRGLELVNLAFTGIQASTPFAMPAAVSSTFTSTSSDRTPSEREALQDERDDIGSWDLVNG